MTYASQLAISNLDSNKKVLMCKLYQSYRQKSTSGLFDKIYVATVCASNRKRIIQWANCHISTIIYATYMDTNLFMSLYKITDSVCTQFIGFSTHCITSVVKTPISQVGRFD